MLSGPQRVHVCPDGKLDCVVGKLNSNNGFLFNTLREIIFKGAIPVLLNESITSLIDKCRCDSEP